MTRGGGFFLGFVSFCNVIKIFQVWASWEDLLLTWA